MMTLRTWSLIGLVAVAIALAGCVPALWDQPTDLETTVEALLTQVLAQSTQIAEHMEYISYLSTRVPPMRPAPVDRPSPTPFVTGSLFIADGACCIAGVAGQAMVIPVVFQSVSPLAEVTEMRARAGSSAFDEADLSDAEWELFSSEKEFEYTPPLNWSGFYVTVQFRDALGNLSAVYASDISVEGMPPAATTPAP